MDKSAPPQLSQSRRDRLLRAIKVYSHPRVVTLFCLGFAAGLPLLLVFSTLSAWLREAGVSRAEIGFFSWVGLLYSIKVFWSPLVDHLKIPRLADRLGRRRSWMLVAQVIIILGLIGMATTDPGENLWRMALFAVLVAFGSATQDIVIDAFRIEAAPRETQAALAASYVYGYRIAMLLAGAGGLYFADIYSWQTSYLLMALAMGAGILTVLMTKEPDVPHKETMPELDQYAGGYRAVQWFLNAIIAPFVDFFKRNGVQAALLILLVVSTFRFTDLTLGIMANPFYIDLGFGKDQIASIGKVWGLIMTLVGLGIGGLMVVALGIWRSLLIAAALAALSNIGFSALASFYPTEGVADGAHPPLYTLGLVISSDNLAGGMATTVFIAWLSSLTNRTYTATQYALFSSLMTLPGKFISGFGGIIVDDYSYSQFFMITALCGIPALVLIWLLPRFAPQAIEPNAPQEPEYAEDRDDLEPGAVVKPGARI